jgi:hypothetical protein
MEGFMSKLGLLATAAVLSASLAAPAMAKHMTRHVVGQTACDPRDPGNPFSKKYDDLTWSAWRRRGGWDDRAEYTCQPIPRWAARW